MYRPWRRHLQFGLAGLLLAVLGSVNARAAIEWRPSSLQEVYHCPGEFYCYAPAVVREGDVVHYWFCRNAVPGVIRDHIYYVKEAPKGEDAHQLALGPAAGAQWDRFHVCDPAVVSGQFHFGSKGFRYALFYLGNNVDASANNEIGVAFANAPSGPWVRRPEPVLACGQEGGWGVGQPAAINRKGQGEVELFYTKAAPFTAGWVCELSFSADGHVSVGKEIRLPTGGLLRSDGRPDWLNNFDVGFDSGRNRYWVVREVHPYPQSQPNFISSTLEVASIAASELRNPKGRWQHEAWIDPGLTGQPRNHNAGLEKTWSGLLPDSHTLRVVFTVSCAGTNCAGTNSLWSYGLWEVCGRINNAR